MIAVPAEVFFMETAGGHLHSNVQRLGGCWCMLWDRKASHNAKMVWRLESPCVLRWQGLLKLEPGGEEDQKQKTTNSHLQA